MKAIWRYPLKIQARQSVLVPGSNPIVLSAQEQHGALVAWIAVEPNAAKHTAVIVSVYGTGHPMEESDIPRYISTVQMHEGDLVLHVYAEKGITA